MNANQKQTVINKLEQIKMIDFETLFIASFGADANQSETSLGDFSYAEFVALISRMVKLFEIKLKSEFDWMMLPTTHNFNNDFGNCSLEGNLSNIFTHTSRKDYRNAIANLKVLIYYQIANNFWDSPARVDVKSRTKSIEIIESKLCQVAESSELRGQRIDELIEKVHQFKNDLSKLITDKTKELEQVKSNLTTSNNDILNIDKSKRASEASSAQIEQLNVKCKSLFDKLCVTQTEIEEQQKASREELEKLQKDVSEELTTITNVNTEKLDEITNDHKYVGGKKDEVVKMMAVIADATLGHSFDAREVKLQTSVTWWTWISVVAAILMGAWIYVVFTCINTQTGNALADICVNAIKTSPLIVLLWFSLRQYQKERNLLEEYAFRKAIAVTLNAYLDRLNGEEDEHKRKLLLDTVDRLYTMPRITNENIGLFSFKTKDLVNILKEVNVTLKEVRGK